VIARRYAGVLLGLSNTAGVLAGVVGSLATGYILQNGSWSQVCEAICVRATCKGRLLPVRAWAGLQVCGNLCWRTSEHARKRVME